MTYNIELYIGGQKYTVQNIFKDLDDESDGQSELVFYGTASLDTLTKLKAEDTGIFIAPNVI